MKRKLLAIIAAIIVAAVVIPANAKGRLFKEMSNVKGCTSVYVGEAVLRVAGDFKLIGETGGVNLNKLMKKVSYIEIVTCENSQYTKDVIAKASDIVSNIENLEIITEVSESSSNADSPTNIVIYYRPVKNTEFMDLLLITIDSNESPVYVAIHGYFTMDDITAAISDDSDEGVAE